MFVGFIAVVVIILVIVGMMSSQNGLPQGGGLIESTNSTSVAVDFLSLKGLASTYKLNAGSYTGISVAELIASGMVDQSLDAYQITAANATAFKTETAGNLVADEYVLKSKAIDGLYYKLYTNSGAYFYVVTVIDTAKIPLSSPQSMNLDKKYSLLSSGTLSYTNVALTDGVARFQFNRI